MLSEIQECHWGPLSEVHWVQFSGILFKLLIISK